MKRSDRCDRSDRSFSSLRIERERRRTDRALAGGADTTRAGGWRSTDQIDRTDHRQELSVLRCDRSRDRSLIGPHRRRVALGFRPRFGAIDSGTVDRSTGARRSPTSRRSMRRTSRMSARSWRVRSVGFRSPRSSSARYRSVTPLAATSCWVNPRRHRARRRFFPSRRRQVPKSTHRPSPHRLR